MKLVAGVIGLGVGTAHAEVYLQAPQCRLKAVCDISEEKLKVFSAQHATIGTTRDPNTILEDPEISVVSVASYDNYHFEQVISAVQRDKHVFVEKPLCLFEHESVQIKELLDRHPRVRLSSNLILRKAPRFIELREMIQSGVLGELFYIEADYNYGRLAKLTEGWRGEIPFYSVVYGGGIHMVDLLMWLTGSKITEVSSVGNNIASRKSKFRFNDLNVSLLQLDSGCVAKVTSNFGCVRPHFHHLAVYGTKGTYINHTADQALLYSSRDAGTVPVKITTTYPGVGKGELLSSFLDGIINDKEIEVSEQEIFDSMSVCFAMERAATEKNRTKVVYL